MKALVLEDYGSFCYKEVEIPSLSDNEVLIEVKACSICGSDIHGADGSTGRRIPPVIMGHEAAGVIVKRGTGVSMSDIGDRVTFDSTIYCCHCIYCQSGQFNLCDNRRVLGVSCDEYHQNGAMAEYVAVPEHIVYKLPENVSFSSAAMVEPLSVGLHALRNSSFEINNSAVVIGAGTIGLLLVQLLKAAGSGKVIVVDLNQKRLDLAHYFGADEIINPDLQNVSAKVRDLTSGRGTDNVYEVVGIDPTIQTAFECVKKGGCITLVGNVMPNVNLPLQEIVTRELRITGSCASAGEYGSCLDLISRGAVDVESLISVEAPLMNGAIWFERLKSAESGLMKVQLIP